MWSNAFISGRQWRSGVRVGRPRLGSPQHLGLALQQLRTAGPCGSVYPSTDFAATSRGPLHPQQPPRNTRVEWRPCGLLPPKGVATEKKKKAVPHADRPFLPIPGSGYPAGLASGRSGEFISRTPNLTQGGQGLWGKCTALSLGPLSCSRRAR